MNDKPSRMSLVAAATIAILGSSVATEAFALQPNVTLKGGNAIYAVPAAERRAPNLASIGDAQAMPLPTVDESPIDLMGEALRQPDSAPMGKPVYSPGAPGTGLPSPMQVPLEQDAVTSELFLEEGAGVEPQEFGTGGVPYTTSRVDTVGNNVSKTYPYSAAGKLYFKDGAGNFVCSASLIKRGVIVTAAHCVSLFGANRFYTNFQFVPAKYKTLAPFGVWTAESISIKTSYFNGTDPCAVRGIVCANDVAVIRLAPQSGAFPGTRTGWFGYGAGGYGFTPNNLALINQLGYPVSHDSGNIMQRTDSQGVVSPSNSNNTVWGSRQTGGSSGGPELVNLGFQGVLATPLGSEAVPNIVVGATSWGYTSPAVKLQGASPFTANNIVSLVNSACLVSGTTRAACR
ncbi:MAG: trypsin-like serine protease [Chromatiaceae bacterium]|nr:trypsin-like serine protease [Chromatiaceae bacterium]